MTFNVSLVSKFCSEHQKSSLQYQRFNNYLLEQDLDQFKGPYVLQVEIFIFYPRAVGTCLQEGWQEPKWAGGQKTEILKPKPLFLSYCGDILAKVGGQLPPNPPSSNSPVLNYILASIIICGTSRNLFCFSFSPLYPFLISFKTHIVRGPIKIALAH